MNARAILIDFELFLETYRFQAETDQHNTLKDATLKWIKLDCGASLYSVYMTQYSTPSSW